MNYKSPTYQKFRKAVLEYPTENITIDGLYSLINRVTWNSKKRYFGYSNNSRFNSRLRYNRFMIKMLEGEGILESIPSLIQVWKINR